ncbi:MAG: LacI family DNA-binding transcriptional regulator [Deltaproteobacteria bacterium]|nr:LacI family DNA-binding transcriptional regulator [Deltaproteobacteria bacterium]
MRRKPPVTAPHPRPERRAPRGRGRRRASRSTNAVTLADVAKIAGVSPITVSRVVNRPELVHADTVAQVQRVIARTGYVPNMLAGGLASRRSRLVAALVPTVVNSIFVDTIQSLTDTLWEARYQVVLGMTGYASHGSREEALVSAILSRRPDAVFVVGVNHSRDSRRRLLTAHVPVVEVWDLTTSPIDMVIGFSHEQVGAAVGDYLVGKGYRRIASVWADDERALRRRKGLLESLARHGLGEAGASLVPAPSTLRGGRQAFAALLDRGTDADAVVCSSDAFAHGVLAEAQVRGIAIPSRLAVLGFGDLEFAAETVPALSSVRIDRHGIGRLAAEALLARIEGKPAGPKVVDVGFQIIERETT